METSTKSVTAGELFAVFGKLGTFGFGGPAAHIAMMREEVVVRRNWLSESEFFDLVGSTNLIPGPNSTELAIHIGHKMLGWKGLLIAGMAFIVPAFLAVLALAMLYVQYGSLPDLSSILMGIRPVIVSIVILALWKFRENSIRNWKEIIVLMLSVIAALAGWNEILVIFLAGTLVALYSKTLTKKLSIEPFVIFWFFTKIGSVLFGSGYVLLAFLQSELVIEKKWLTSSQLLDAITVGQVTPGPVFTTATFVGYLLSGTTGAIVATIGIFLPAFFFVAVSAPFLGRLRSSEFFSQFLNGVNAASFALMAIVTFQLAQKSIIDIPTISLCIISLGILKFTRINSAYLIISSGILGYFIF